MAKETLQSINNKVGRSVVANVIDFKASEDASWRSTSRSGKKDDMSCPSTVKEMIEDIVEWQSQFKERENDIDRKSLEKVQDELLTDFIYFLNREEDHGLGTREETEQMLRRNREKHLVNKRLSREEQETLNIYNAYQYLKETVDEECQEDKTLVGFVEGGIVKELHKIILNNLPVSNGMTKPGVCSNKQRCTTFRGEVYFYQKPDNMEEAMNTLLDRFNSLLEWLNSETDEKDRVYKLFRASSWLLFELLDLHPFSDGNGRLCRLLCSYTLSVLTPFPTPVYNIWYESSAKSSANDYHEALVNARKSENSYPEELTTMVIESNWYAWQEFFEKLSHQGHCVQSLAPKHDIKHVLMGACIPMCVCQQL